MSRAIEFRGLTVDGDFVYGFYVQDAYDGTSRNVAHGIQSAGCYPVEIDPKTLGQFTGLHDCNGVKIFEGDIVKMWYAPRSTANCLVNFNDGCFELDVKNATPKTCLLKDVENNGNTLTVIGNIHQNSELLK